MLSNLCTHYVKEKVRVLNQPLVSVIIPVYKVSDYLDRCIESLVIQSYSNLEIILVDDGSPDECALMCDEWAKKDSRIMVIHKTNGGQAEARNYGMQIVCGEYISFIDSDDYVFENFVEVLLSTALKNDSDIVVCGFAKCYENGQHDDYSDNSSETDYSTHEGMEALLKGTPFHLHVWDKLFRREVIKDLSFEVGRIHEDVSWIYKAFGESKRITKINRTLYYYLQRESSTTGHGYSSLRSLDFLDEKRDCQLYIEKNYPDLALQAKLDFFGSCMYLMQCVIKYMSGKERRQAIARIRKYKKMCHIAFKEISTVQGASKKYYYLAKINIYLCCKIRADLNIGF